MKEGESPPPPTVEAFGSFSFPDEGEEEANIPTSSITPSERQDFDMRLARAASSQNLLGELDAITIDDSPAKATPSMFEGPPGETLSQRYERLQKILQNAQSKLDTICAEQ